MKLDRWPVLAGLVMALVLGVAACVDTFEPAGPDRPGPGDEPDPGEGDEDFRAAHVYSGGTLLRLPS